MNRRNFLLSAAGLVGLSFSSGCRNPLGGKEPQIQTVLGLIPASKLGFTLSHEHVLCDFIGAKETGPHRWNTGEVILRMEPYLRSAREKGIRSFVDCTPAYIGRDPELLRHLASRTGLQILTNTGYYGGAGDKYVPQHAYQEPAELLANRWLREHQSGIGNTGIKPGFIKTGVDEISGSTLSDIDAKLIRAASLTSQRSGLAVVCHTGGGAAGVAALKLFLQTGGRPDRFIVAHSDSHGVDFNYQVHDLGGWVSFDAVSRRPIEEHVKLISQMWKTNRRRLLLSQDNGWYSVGQPNGGEVRGYTDLGEKLLPQLRVNGFDAEELEELMVTNPARAFSLRPS